MTISQNFSLLTSKVCVCVCMCVCVSGGGGNTYTYLLSHQTVPRITCKYAPKRLNEVPDTLSLFSRSAVSDSFATPWTGSFLSIGFPRQEHWSELPFPPPGDLPNPGIEPVSLHLLSCRRLTGVVNGTQPTMAVSMVGGLYRLVTYQRRVTAQGIFINEPPLPFSLILFHRS